MKILKPIIMSVLVMAASATLFTSCNTAGCTENQNSLPLAGFYSMSTKLPVSLSDLTVMGIGAPGDSLLYESGRMLSQIYLPLRATKDVTSYRFTYNSTSTPDHPDAVTDELTFTYQSHPWFASEQCGAMYRYRITSINYTRNLIDSVGITDSLITNLDVEKIRIYFRDQPVEGGDE